MKAYLFTQKLHPTAIRASSHPLTYHRNTSAEDVGNKWNNFGKASQELEDSFKAFEARYPSEWSERPKKLEQIQKQYNDCEKRGYSSNTRQNQYLNAQRPKSFDFMPLLHWTRKKENAFEAFKEAAGSYKAKKDPDSKSKLTPVNFARTRFSDFLYLNPLANAIAGKDVATTLNLLKSRQISPSDNINELVETRMAANPENHEILAQILGGSQQADNFAVEVCVPHKERDLNKGSVHGIPSTKTKEEQAELAREWAKEDIETARNQRDEKINAARIIQAAFRRFKARKGGA